MLDGAVRVVDTHMAIAFAALEVGLFHDPAFAVVELPFAPFAPVHHKAFAALGLGLHIPVVHEGLSALTPCRRSGAYQEQDEQWTVAERMKHAAKVAA